MKKEKFIDKTPEILSKAPLGILRAATYSSDDVLSQLQTSRKGLASVEASKRLKEYGINDLVRNKPNIWLLLLNELKNPMLILLFVTAVFSVFFEQVGSAIVIGIILVASVAVSLFNEYRSAKTADALHNHISYEAITLRDNTPQNINVRDLVPGDIVRLHIGQVAPADMRLLQVTDFACDESILTGESRDTAKNSETITGKTPNILDLDNCVLMGTVVKTGSALGVVVSTGSRTELGNIASKLSKNRQETDFQRGLRRYSTFLMEVAIAATLVILIANFWIQRSWIQTALFAFTVAIGITPQLLPAVVSTSLGAGSKMLARKKVLVKRLVSIEDLGDVDVLITDKTGTLTEGHINFESAVDPDGKECIEALQLASYASSFEVDALGKIVAANDLDKALGEEAARRHPSGWNPLDKIIDSHDFDHNTQIAAALVDDIDEEHPGLWMVAKGAPEKILARCIGYGNKRFEEESAYPNNPLALNRTKNANKKNNTATSSTDSNLQTANATETVSKQVVFDMLEELFAQGLRVIAVATKVVDDRKSRHYNKRRGDSSDIESDKEQSTNNGIDSEQTIEEAVVRNEISLKQAYEELDNEGYLSPEEYTFDNLVKNLTLVGFITFLDQPKGDAKESLDRLKKLGVEVKIATGDNVLVAQTVCAKLGIVPETAMTSEEFSQLKGNDLRKGIEETSIFARVTPEEKETIVRTLQKSGKSVAFLGDGINDALALHSADVGISVDTATDVAKEAAGIILLDKDLGVIADGISLGRRIFNNTIKYILMGTSSNFGNMFSAVGASLILPFLPMTPGQILLNNLLYGVSQLTIPSDKVDEEIIEKPSHWDIGFIGKFMVIFGPISSIFDYVTFGVMLWIVHASVPVFQTGWFIESLCTQTLIVYSIRTRRVPFWKSWASWPLTISTIGIIIIAFILPYSPLAGFLELSPPPWIFYIALLLMMITYLILVESAKVWFYYSMNKKEEKRMRALEKYRESQRK